jgi:hypothetical protein
MEGELWKVVYRLVVSLGKRPAGCSYSDTVVALVWLWAVLHDRPLSWALRPPNGPRQFEGLQLPSYKTVRVRLKSRSVLQLLVQVNQALVAASPSAWCHWIDGRPLAVSWHSRDRDARVGRGAGGLAKGYKLHVICSQYRVIESWGLMPMNVSEVTMAKVMLRSCPGNGYLVGDRLFDSNRLHKRAAEAGYRLVTGKLRPGVGLGHCPHRRERIESLQLADRPFGQGLLIWRGEVERLFGTMGNCGEGLGPLPNWVRRLSRVRRWVQGKIIFYHARILLKNKGLAA